MITLEMMLAMALKDAGVLQQLGGALRSDLVTANPFYRRIVEEALAFHVKHGMVPRYGDYDMWLATLEPGLIRDGTSEALGRLFAVDTSGFTPEYVGPMALEQMRKGAANVARARMNEQPQIEPGLFAAMAAKLDSLAVAAPRRASLFPTIGDLLREQREGTAVSADVDELIPRLAWRGRHVMLAGLPKIGKSTFIAAGAAAMTRGSPFLGRSTVAGRVLWLGMDEHSSDAYVRLTDNGANRLRVVVEAPGQPAPFLVGVLRDPDNRPDLVVVDSLIEYTRRTSREVPSSGDASGWTPIVRQLTHLAHEHDVGIVTIHHSRKSDGQYRDSTEIAAAMDVLITILPGPKDDPDVRRIMMEGRQPMVTRTHNYGVRLRVQDSDIPLPPGAVVPKCALYELTSVAPAEGAEAGESDLAQQLEANVTAHPGAKQQAVLDAVPGPQNKKWQVLGNLVDTGRVRKESQGKGHVYFPAEGTAAGGEQEQSKTALPLTQPGV